MTNVEDITPEDSVIPIYLDPTPLPLPDPELNLNPTVDELRYAAYIAPDGSDAVYMKWQRGKATKQDWLDAVAAIKARYPDEE